MGLCHTLWRVATKDEARTAAVAERLVARLLQSQDPPRLLEPLVSLIVGLALARSNEWASGVLDDVLARPDRFADTLSQAVFDALNYVKPDRLSTPDEVAEARRALAWIMRALDAAATQLRQLRTAAVALTNDGVQPRMQSLFRCIDQVVARFLFDADVDPNLRSNQSRPLSDAHRRHYYALIKPVLEQVLDISREESTGVLLAPTAHHMMRLLRGVLHIDPQGALHLAARVATASEAAGFTVDSLAVHDMVELVEAVLADYRGEVRQRETMSDLLTLLDVFASAGWPEALRLIWRLDEVFR
jgi:hypothetical protein